MTCIIIPEQPFIARVPSRVDEVPQFAWNGGANSIAELEGNVRAAFSMGLVIGVVIGLTQDLSNIANRARVSHGFYFHCSAAGSPLFQVIESGVLVTPALPYVNGDGFEIQRIGSAVAYFHEGELSYRSLEPLSGSVSVGTSMYATGDQVQ